MTVKNSTVHLGISESGMLAHSLFQGWPCQRRRRCGAEQWARAPAPWPAAGSFASGSWRSPCKRKGASCQTDAGRCVAAAARYQVEEVGDDASTRTMGGAPRSLTIITGGSRGEYAQLACVMRARALSTAPLPFQPAALARHQPLQWRAAMTTSPLQATPCQQTPATGLGRRLAEALLATGDPSTGHAARCAGGHDVLLLAANGAALAAAVADLRETAASDVIGGDGGGSSNRGDLKASTDRSKPQQQQQQRQQQRQQQQPQDSEGAGSSSPRLRLKGVAVDLGDLDTLEGFAQALVTSRAQVGPAWRASPDMRILCVVLVAEWQGPFISLKGLPATLGAAHACSKPCPLTDLHRMLDHPFARARAGSCRRSAKPTLPCCWCTTPGRRATWSSLGARARATSGGR